MQIKQLEQAIPARRNSGFKNLIVSGCSFTHNNNTQHSIAWPEYLALRYAIPTVVNCAFNGAGNSHINASTQWALESNYYDPADTLVAVMWSGNDRDDLIVNSNTIDPKYPFSYEYSPGVAVAVTGGSSENCLSNTHKSFGVVTELKSPASRAVENYLYVNSLYNYLENRGYRFVFLDFLDRRLPNRTLDFDIADYLAAPLAERYRSRFIPVDNIYAWCLRRNLLEQDDFHPSPAGHLDWTDCVLVPYLDRILF
jgi:hypothetical protein